MIERIGRDLNFHYFAIKASKINPFFIFNSVFYLIFSLILVFFLTALGRKVFQILKIKLPILQELLFSLGLGIIFWGTLMLISGILNILYFWVIWGLVIFLLLYLLPEMVRVLEELGKVRIKFPKNLFKKILTLIFSCLVFLNLLGALTPEKGVDAIGYHLYFPKIYLKEHSMMLPARGSRLFSLFPHLASMIYLLPVSLNMPNVAQLFHFLLGVLTALTIGLIAEKIRKGTFIVAALIFYSPVIVGSISRNTYSDFFVTFFLGLGILALFSKKTFLSGIMFGGMLATKNQSLALIPLILIGVGFLKSFKLLGATFLVSGLWYLRSMILTGNPFYPIFSVKNPRIPEIVFQPVFILIIFGAIYLIKHPKTSRLVLLALLVYLYWVFLPVSFHDNRYFLPYLILIILLTLPLLKWLYQFRLFKLGVLGVFGTLLAFRFYTNILYLPYIFGFEEKSVFLSNALKDRPEDFYDIEGKFSKVLTQNDKILTENVLGLYYLDFPYVEYEYSPFYGKKFTKEAFTDLWKKESFSYLLVKNEPLEKFLDKIGVGERVFTLKVADEQSKTYLYSPNFE